MDEMQLWRDRANAHMVFQRRVEAASFKARGILQAEPPVGNQTYRDLEMAKEVHRIVNEHEGCVYAKYRDHEFSMLNADGTPKPLWVTV